MAVGRRRHLARPIVSQTLQFLGIKSTSDYMNKGSSHIHDNGGKKASYTVTSTATLPTGHRQTDMAGMSVTLPLAMATPKKEQDIEARKQASKHKHKSCPPSSLPSKRID